MATAFNIPDKIARAQRPLRTLIEIGLIVLVAVTVARMGWLILAPQASVADMTTRPLPSPIMQASAALSTDRTVLAQTNPFQTEQTIVEIDAPETQLNLSLAGLIMSTSEGAGSAQITTPDNRTARFIVGDEILPGVELERILSDRVILNRNGEGETLMFGNRGAGLSVITDGNLARTETANPRSPSDQTQPSVAVLEGSVSSPEALLQAARLSPIERGGRLFGYALTVIGAHAVITKASLEQDDILIEVNGTRVSELDITELLEELGAGSVANLQIERGGIERTVRLRFEG